MIAAAEIWEVGSTKFTIEVTGYGKNFIASCDAIPRIIATGTTIKNALRQFEENVSDFFAEFVASLPLKERREICLWMQDPEHPEYVPKLSANKRPKMRKSSDSPPAEPRVKVGSKPCFP